jgi:hypothetical protein
VFFIIKKIASCGALPFCATTQLHGRTRTLMMMAFTLDFPVSNNNGFVSLTTDCVRVGINLLSLSAVEFCALDNLTVCGLLV